MLKKILFASTFVLGSTAAIAHDDYQDANHYSAHEGLEVEEVVVLSGSQAHDEEAFDPTEMIMHHVLDAHEFHIAGDVSIPLPVILWTDKGLVTFMSSAFHHNDNGEQVVEAGGQRFVKFHEKIYYASDEANAHGQYVELDEHHHPHNAKPMDFSITKNVFTLILSSALLLLIFGSVARFYKRNEKSAPRGLAGFMEPLILFVRDDIAAPNIGHKYGRYMPYLLTVFFFIWLNNLMGLIPVFPFSANLTGNIAVTLVLAFITLLITAFSGNRSYWGHIFAPPVPKALWFLMIPVELIGVFTKPFALMVRLFANITAGHIVVLSLVSLIFIFKNVGMAGVSVPFALFISVLELLVAFLQAYIFTMLSALFIGQAVEEHQHDHH